MLSVHFPEKCISVLTRRFVINIGIEITILPWKLIIYIFIRDRIIRNWSDGIDSNFMTKCEAIFQSLAWTIWQRSCPEMISHNDISQKNYVMKHFQKYGWPAQCRIMKHVSLTRNCGSLHVAEVQEVGGRLLRFLGHLFIKNLASIYAEASRKTQHEINYSVKIFF